MAPVPAALPDCFEVHADDAQRIRCTLCGSTNWIQRKGWKVHIGTSSHVAAAQRQTALRSVRACIKEAYELAQTNPAPLASAEIPSAPSSPQDLSMAPPPDDLAHDLQSGVMEVDMEYARAAVAAAHTQTAEEFRVKLTLALVDLIHGFGLMQMAQDVSGGQELDATVTGAFVDEEPELDTEEIESAFFDSESASALRARDSEWFPYENKTLFFLDLLTNLPRLRLSDAQIRMILWVMEQTGSHSVPSLYRLRKCQKQLQAMIGAPTVQHRSELGNIFYSNDIRATIAMEFANPQVAKHFKFYPVLNAQRVSEVWHATRWWEVPPELLTPMACVGSLKFFVNEICMLHDGSFVVPFIWFQFDSSDTPSGAREEIYAMSYQCIFDEVKRHLTVDTTTPIEVALSQMAIPLPALLADKKLPELDADYKAYMEENPLRIAAKDEEVYTIFVNLWADDVSGNVSKQYNKHLNIYVSNMNLPSALLSQEYFVRFFSTSPHASAAEQFAAVKDQILKTHDTPHPCFNAHTGRVCRFRIVAQALPGDNPQQAENCSCLPGQANLNCRRCKNVRRPPKDSVGVEWYIKNYSQSEHRTTGGTLASVQEQFKLAATGVASKVSEEQTRSGVKDPVAEVWVQRIIAMARERIKEGKSDLEEIAQDLKVWLESQPGDHYHPLLTWSGLDPHIHTPVEILHTILLGLVKYVWHSLHSSWKTEHEALFSVRLQSSDISGLSIDPLRAAYMMQYKNGLIGKHFKSLTQLMVFHIHGISTPQQFALVKATGLLAAMLWYHEIENMDEYLDDLQVLIDNVLDAYAAIDPTRILTKFKLHVLVHLVDDIRRYGPAIRFATEIFESFNAIFRMCSVLSNHQAPSRDIAVALARMDRFKHIVSGGFWYNEAEKIWQQASSKVRSVLEHKIVQQHLGWSPIEPTPAGIVVPIAAKKAVARGLSPRERVVLRSSPLSHLHNAAGEQLEWIDGVSVTAKTGDVCRPNGWVVFDVGNDTKCIGRIVRISILHSGGSTLPFPALVTIREYNLAAQHHPEFDMPILTCSADAALHVLEPKALQFNINVQHDCRTCDCQPAATRPVLQERQQTTRTALEIKHKADERYIINLHAFHNAALIRKVLPVQLRRPKRLTADRDSWLQKTGEDAQVALTKNAEVARKKRAQTRADKAGTKETVGPGRRKRSKHSKSTRKHVPADQESESAGEVGAEGCEEELASFTDGVSESGSVASTTPTLAGPTTRAQTRALTRRGRKRKHSPVDSESEADDDLGTMVREDETASPAGAAFEAGSVTPAEPAIPGRATRSQTRMSKRTRI